MRHLLRPFPWTLLGHVCLGILLAPLMALVLVAAVVMLPLVVMTPVPFLVSIRGLAGLLAIERARFAVLQDQQVGQPLVVPDGATGAERVQALLVAPAFGRAVGYVVVRCALALMAVVVLSVAFTAPLVLWFALLLALLTPLRPTGMDVLSEDTLAIARWLILPGPVLLAPALIRGLAWVDGWVALALLGGDRTESLSRRVGELVEARARTVSAADAERSRLERDLHDGVQQRLIALSVLLGQAEVRLTDAARAEPAAEGALALVQRARAETAGSIDDLRTLTRGLRPPILAARGLDAALSAVASRLPMPTWIEVEMGERPEPALEAILYFAVAEALTNVAKHAEGQSATVRVAREPGLVRATVTDTGPGGAEVVDGGGLRGLADRLAGVDGRLFLSSPAGGPTVLTVEVPCA